ncbi:unnamed protein product [Brassica rapa subsp. trilocularis]
MSEMEQGIFEQVLKGGLDFVSEPRPSVSESAKDLVRRMLIRDPKKRMKAHEVLCHPWARVDGVALDTPLDSAVLTRLTQFSAMNKLNKIAVKRRVDVHLDDILSEVDKDNDGRIDYSEFVEMMQDTGFGKMGLVVS